MALEIEANIRWGELREHPIAKVLAAKLWPGSSIYRLKPTADLDFGVVDGNVLVGLLEIKARRFSHNTFPTTAVHKRKHEAGRYARRYLKIPVYCGVLFEDRLGYFDLSTTPDYEEDINLPERGTTVPHSFYSVERMYWLPDDFPRVIAEISAIQLGAIVPAA